MKKSLLIIILVLLAISALTACKYGNIDNVNRIVGVSSVFRERDIELAMDVVCSNFSRGFGGCSLQELKYDEVSTQKEALEWAEQYNEEEAIVLTSCFAVGPKGGGGSLNPMSVYENWKWILTRSNGGQWVLRTCGYG